LRGLPGITDPNVLVGTSTADDAGVIRISPDVALVQTVDFFTPIVDDPRSFGSIAAANALSDVYAMGGRPVSALAIAAFPEDVDPEILADILRGGVEKAKEAGIDIIGGHTVKDREPKYGLAVTGIIHPDRVIRNDTAKPGDALILTKPLGTGILTTARRSDTIDDAAMHEAIASMNTLNRTASEVMLTYGAHAATDITGFGFIGHLKEMIGARLGADIWANAVPLLREALELAEREIYPGGTQKNLDNALQAGAEFHDGVPQALRIVLCDAQTSGGLLVAIEPGGAAGMVDELRAKNVVAAQVGTITDSGRIVVRVK